METAALIIIIMFNDFWYKIFFLDPSVEFVAQFYLSMKVEYQQKCH